MQGASARRRWTTPTHVHVLALERYFQRTQSEEPLAQASGIPFGEYLVDRGVLDRFQLFRALQLQDRTPTLRIGECAAALGYASINAIERFFEHYAARTPR